MTGSFVLRFSLEISVVVAVAAARALAVFIAGNFIFIYLFISCVLFAISSCQSSRLTLDRSTDACLCRF